MMHRHTGTLIPLEAHVYQSVRVILFTLIGTRLCRRDFGSVIPMLIDQPLGESTLALLRAAVFMALKRWERRITLQGVAFSPSDGAVEIVITGLLNDRAINWTYKTSRGVE